MTRLCGNRASREHFENRLRKLQQGLCSICSEPLHRDERYLDGTGWSLDHVFPRSRYKRLGNRGNVLLAHRACNGAKAAREPTGCEILLLHGVNARLGHELLDVEARDYADERRGPTALELAFARVQTSSHVEA